MNKFEQIKQYIEAGLIVDFKMNNCWLRAKSIQNNRIVIVSSAENRKDLDNKNCSYAWDEEELSGVTEIITVKKFIKPLPEKTKVTIADGWEDYLESVEYSADYLKEFSKQNDLEISGYDGGDYEINSKTLNNWYHFPFCLVLPKQEAEVVELTLEEIAEKFGVDVSKLKIKK